MKDPPLRFATFERNAARSRTLPELKGAFQSIVQLFGFTAFAVGFAPREDGPNEPFLLVDWPRAWLELYAREGFASEDAVVAAAATAQIPFTWKELQERQPGASARIFAAARKFGWSDGLLVPVRLAVVSGSDQLGVASLAAPTLDLLDADGRACVVAVAHLAFKRAIELSEYREAKPLSNRERAALGMVAAGRSDRDIAAAFSVSVATAHFHVEQAKRKLGAVTRAQAVAFGVGQGLISVD